MRGSFFRQFFGIVAIISVIFGLVVPQKVAVAATPTYAASVVSLSVPRSLAPGQVDQIRVTIKNLGSTTWKRDVKNYVALYRWNPTTKQEIASAFARPSWDSALRPAKLPIDSVAPNEEAAFTFPVRAPDKPGVYREQYILASEGVAWIPRSVFDVELNVAGTASVPAILDANNTTIVESSLPTSSEWRAELVNKGGIEWQVEAGDRVVAEVSFRNVGSATWERTSGPFVSIYAVDPTGKQERASAFIADAEAMKPVARLIEAAVPPGLIGHFKIQLRGPSVGGFYKETFALAAEDKAWLDGGAFVLPIRVPGRDEFIGTAPPDTAPLSSDPMLTPTNNLYGVLSTRSAGSISGAGSAQKEFVVSFKNVSSVSWKNSAIRFIDLRRPVYSNDSSLQDASWSNTNEAIRLLGTTRPGDSASFAFTFRLPADQGAYTALFQLYVDGLPVQNTVIEIPILVTSSAASRIAKPPVSTTPSAPRPTTPAVTTPVRPPVEAIPLNGDINALPAEPVIRVGVLRTVDDRSVIQAMNVPILVQQSGSTVCTVSPGQQVSVVYHRTSRVYILGEACSGQSSSYYVFRAQDGLSPMLVSDYDRNDNAFRAQLELRYTPATDSVWLINELPVEWYLKGIAETSNASPAEFQRTLLTTARTYAVYHIQRSTKHADEYYTVDARYDQVYRGYDYEARTPTISAAVDATRGQIVTYQGRLAITPYFSRSDGRTRGWGEVWGGASNYPWLVSVSVPEDSGRTLWGHGVGMSATGALDMAVAGKTYSQILTHFYQGTELRRAYK